MNVNPFRLFLRPEAEWFSVGMASSFPDLGLDDGDLLMPRPCSDGLKPGCKVFYSPTTDSSQRSQLSVADDAFLATEKGKDLKDQVLVFQYRGKFHAIDHVSLSLCVSCQTSPDMFCL